MVLIYIFDNIKLYNYYIKLYAKKIKFILEFMKIIILIISFFQIYCN